MQVVKFETEVLRYRDGRKVRESKTVRLDIPTAVTEITLRAWADFTDLRETAPAIFTDVTVGDVAAKAIPAEQWTAFVEHSLKAIHTLACNRKDVAMSDLLSLPVGDSAADAAGGSILAILMRIMKPIAEYVPKNRESFTHAGRTYVFYTNYLDQFDTRWIGRELRTAEAVEALQFEQAFFQKDDKGNYYTPDPRYRNTLALLALLTRRVDPLTGDLELPPISLAERTEWLDRRMLDLAGVSMDVGLDIDFFLPSSKILFQRIRSSVLPGRKAEQRAA